MKALHNVDKNEQTSNVRGPTKRNRVRRAYAVCLLRDRSQVGRVQQSCRTYREKENTATETLVFELCRS